MTRYQEASEPQILDDDGSGVLLGDASPRRPRQEDDENEDPIVAIAMQLSLAKELGSDIDACRYCRQHIPGKVFEHESQCEMRPKRKQNVVAKNAVRNKPKNPVKKNNWRDQHNQIQQVIKLGREMNALQS